MRRCWPQFHRTELLTRYLCSISLGLIPVVSPPPAVSYLASLFSHWLLLSVSPTLHMFFFNSAVPSSHWLSFILSLPKHSLYFPTFSSHPVILYLPQMSSSHPHPFTVTPPPRPWRSITGDLLITKSNDIHSPDTELTLATTTLQVETFFSVCVWAQK